MRYLCRLPYCIVELYCKVRWGSTAGELVVYYCTAAACKVRWGSTAGELVVYYCTAAACLIICAFGKLAAMNASCNQDVCVQNWT